MAIKARETIMIKYDVLILGGGPAGLSAAINAKARNKTALIISNPIAENPLWKSDFVDNHIGMPKQTGAEMLENMHNHAVANGVDFMEGRALSAIATTDGFFVSVGTEVAEGRTIILATGVARGKKFVGEEEFLGKGVSYCATCDAFAFRGKTVAVLGYSESAKHEAEFLEQVGCTVHYFHKPKKVILQGAETLQSISINGEELAVEGAFILRPTMAPTDLFPTLALNNGYIIVDRNMATNIKNVYAAGDCTGAPLQVSKAVGEGLIAGQEASKK